MPARTAEEAGLSDDGTTGKRAALPPPERLASWDALKAFVREGGLCAVAVLAGWEREKSASVADAVAALRGVHAATVVLDEDDESGEITFEAGLSAAPCVLVYSGGRHVKTVAGADVAAVAAAVDAERFALPAVETEEEFQELAGGSGYVVFDFYADWCAPCNRIKPRLKQLAEAFPEAAFYKVCRDKLLALHEACGVQKIPTFQVYKAGTLRGSLQHSNYEKVHAFIAENTKEESMCFDEDF